MTETKFKPVETDSILANLREILSIEDSTLMTKETYNFLYLMSGFIAHYNLYGFIAYYQDTAKLLRDLGNSTDIKDPKRIIRDPFFIKAYGEAYCKSIVETFIGIKRLVEDYNAIYEIRRRGEDDEMRYKKEFTYGELTRKNLSQHIGVEEAKKLSDEDMEELCNRIRRDLEDEVSFIIDNHFNSLN